MKKLLLLVISLSLLLTGCSSVSKAPQTPPAQTPVYDTAPATDGWSVRIDGKTLTRYKVNEQSYLQLEAMLGEKGTVNNPDDSKAPYGCSFSYDGALCELATDSPLLLVGESETDLGANPIFDGKNWYLPADKLLSHLNQYTDEDQKTVYYTDYPAEMENGHRLPILMYHAVEEEPWGIASLFVRPTEMDKQLAYLKDNGYTTITFEDVDRLDEIEKPVMLTFDDGYEDNYTELFPLLKKYGAKATIFVITGEIGKPYYLTEAQIKEMSDSGLVSIQSHTVTHPFLSDLGEEQLVTELADSKLTLARITGKEPFVICYPTGKTSALAREVCARYYKYGLLMNGGTFTTNGDNFRITRSYIARTTDIWSFASML